MKGLNMADKSQPGPLAQVIAFLVVIAGGFFIYHLISGTVTSALTSDSKPTVIKTQPDAFLGQSVRDGKFSFVVKSMQCGATTISTEVALGQFCVVRLSITNIGKVANMIDVTSQKLLDAKGTSYDERSMAGMLFPENDNFELTNLNPGLSVTGAIVYDVPKTTTPVAIELHDGFISDGKQVLLQNKK